MCHGRVGCLALAWSSRVALVFLRQNQVHKHRVHCFFACDKRFSSLQVVRTKELHQPPPLKVCLVPFLKQCIRQYCYTHLHSRWGRPGLCRRKKVHTPNLRLDKCIRSSCTGGRREQTLKVKLYSNRTPFMPKGETHLCCCFPRRNGCNDMWPKISTTGTWRGDGLHCLQEEPSLPDIRRVVARALYRIV